MYRDFSTCEAEKFSRGKGNKILCMLLARKSLKMVLTDSASVQSTTTIHCSLYLSGVNHCQLLSFTSCLWGGGVSQSPELTFCLTLPHCFSESGLEITPKAPASFDISRLTAIKPCTFLILFGGAGFP